MGTNGLNEFYSKITGFFCEMRLFDPLLKGELDKYYGESGQLLQALYQKNYPALYAALRRQKDPVFPIGFALRAAEAALSCTPRAFREVVDRCAFDSPHLNVFEWQQVARLVLEAICMNKPEHLRILLDAGASPNQITGFSPLAAAVYERNQKCLRVLLNRPDLSPELPEDVLVQWADAENGDVLLDFCLSDVADHFLPRESPLMPLPLPPGLTLSMAALQDNIPLLERLSRERTDVRLEEALDAILALDWNSAAFAGALGSLLTACPEVLEDPCARWALLSPALRGREIPQTLRPWIGRLEGEAIPLWWDKIQYARIFLAPGMPETWAKLAAVWRRQFGDRLHLVLDRRFSLPHFLGSIDYNIDADTGLFLDDCCSSSCPMKPAELDALLDICQVRGDPVPGEASDFAKSLVCMASPGRLLRELRPGGLLDGEDLRQLADFRLLREDHSAQGRAKRAMLLACV